MPLRADLLTAIPGPNPSGVDLRYDPTYDKIKDARREDDELPQGAWQANRKTADHALVVKLAGDALATKTKDLQLAAWLTEALLKREGFGGLRDGLALVRTLVADFWDSLYPELDEGDSEPRAAVLDWLANNLIPPVRLAPINNAGHSVLQYVQSRTIPYEDEAKGNPEKKKARDTAIAEKRLPPEVFDKSVNETPKAWYKALVANLGGCAAELQALGALSNERFGSDGPNFSKLRDAIDEVQAVASQFLGKKLEFDPDPIEPVVESPADSGPLGTGPAEIGGDGAAGVGLAGGGMLAAEPVDRGDATARVVAAARFLRRTEPTSPASYLLLRGLRWGELRAGGSYIDPKLLEAPPTPVRSQLKRLLLDGRWAELLDTAEGVAASPHGRGWLDLQRYVLTACDELGAEYGPVSAAIRAELRALLDAFPQLPEMTLMDDTPVANAETQAWLRAEALHTAAGAGGDGDSASHGTRANGNGADRNGAGMPSHGAYDRATAELRAGRPERAIDILMRELARERSARRQFILKTQVSGIMVEAGLEAIAMPILRELLERIDAHKLEDWEAGEMVAQPMVLLCRCIDKLKGDQTQRQALYLRVCRLDPLQALRLSTPA
jgi:type VI secretion system protein ImpA